MLRKDLVKSRTYKFSATPEKLLVHFESVYLVELWQKRRVASSVAGLSFHANQITEWRGFLTLDYGPKDDTMGLDLF